jgi:hypothetical protein
MQLQTSTVTAVALPAAQGIFCYLSETLHPFMGSLVLPPDSLVIIAGSGTNSAVDCNVRWYERVAQSGELV